MPLNNIDDIRQLQPAVLAFMGDAVFELFIRERLIRNKRGTSHNLHIHSTNFVKAASQANIARILHDSFTEEETYIFRRGRNAKSTTIPKNADVQDYKYATGFEAVLGYLYLTGQHERLSEIMEKAALIVETQERPMKNEKE